MKPLTAANKRELDKLAAKSIKQAAAGKDVSLTFPSEADRKAAVPYLLKKLKGSGLQLGAPYKVKKGTDNTGGPGLGKTSHDVGATESAEADAILALVTDESAKELIAAKATVLDPKQNAHVKAVCWSLLQKNANNNGNVQPALPAAHDADDVNAVLQPGDIAKLRMEFDACTDSVTKSALGERITFETLRAIHHTSPKVAKSVNTTDDPEHITRLRTLIKSADLDPAVRDQAGLVLTKHDLAKAAYDDQLAATCALVQETQAHITAASATLGTSGGALLPRSAAPRVQTGSIPLMVSLSERLAPTGKIEPEPAAVLGKDEDELAKAESRCKPGSTSRDVDFWREKVTYQRLLMTHES